MEDPRGHLLLVANIVSNSFLLLLVRHLLLLAWHLFLVARRPDRGWRILEEPSATGCLGAENGAGHKASQRVPKKATTDVASI